MGMMVADCFSRVVLGIMPPIQPHVRQAFQQLHIAVEQAHMIEVFRTGSK
jgi:hypothetical protein